MLQGCPDGIAFSIPPDTNLTGSAQFIVPLNVSAAPSTQAGVYQGTIVVTIGAYSLPQALSIGIVQPAVVRPVPDIMFGLSSVCIGQVDIKPGSSGLREITIRPNGAEGPVSVHAAGYPNGIAFSVPPGTTLTGSADLAVPLNVTAPPDAKAGAYQGTIVVTVGASSSPAKVVPVGVLPPPLIEVQAGASITRYGVITIGPADTEGPVAIRATGFPEALAFSIPADTTSVRGVTKAVPLTVSAAPETDAGVYGGTITAVIGSDRSGAGPLSVLVVYDPSHPSGVVCECGGEVKGAPTGRSFDTPACDVCGTICHRKCGAYFSPDKTRASLQWCGPSCLLRKIDELLANRIEEISDGQVTLAARKEFGQYIVEMAHGGLERCKTITTKPGARFEDALALKVLTQAQQWSLAWEKKKTVRHADESRQLHIEARKAQAKRRATEADDVMKSLEHLLARGLDQGSALAPGRRDETTDGAAISARLGLALSHASYPQILPREHEVDFIAETGTAILNYRLPVPGDLPTLCDVKYTSAGDTFTEQHLTAAQHASLYDDVVYQIALRVIHEVFRSDCSGSISAAAFNGFVKSTDEGTGHQSDACILSIHTSRAAFEGINLANVHPKACCRQLKGVGSSKLHGMTPIAPIMDLPRSDRRFVAPYGVADQLHEGVNLASMDWEDFEHLIREIFEKEFSSVGGEVKVTQASRDRGVDAVVFDPDPIRGGKIVIQAKRYAYTVDVSSVRDLYGTMLNEGAMKGILVTSSNYGPDAYEFAKDKPLTLLSGSNLLHLLQKHGVKAHIDLAEARKRDGGSTQS